MCATAYDGGVTQSSDNETRRAEALAAELADFDLDDDDRALLAGEEIAVEESRAGWPIVAVVGRPNVGKSTLVNRILGRRAAVVQDTPGVTRDRVSYPAHWNGRDFMLVDTGGWEVDVAGMDKSVATQAEIAIDRADAVIFVVDATVGATATDERVVALLRKVNKPVLLAANKVDSQMQEADAAALWSLGLGEPYSVSGLHGRGSGDLLDRLLQVLPERSAHAPAIDDDGARRIALVGRPNVGKSSLLNQLAGEGRVVVDDTAGTTRDPVDELIELDGEQWWFMDTAGIRRRANQASGADYYAVLRTQQALEAAELALVLIDASVKLTEQDIRVVQAAIDAGRALVIVMNKWDEVDEDRRIDLAREVEQEFVRLSWAPMIRISAKTGWHTNRITRAMREALTSWDQRISTGKLNAFLGELQAANPHPVRGGKQPRIMFGTQIANRPPRFVLFTTGFLDPGYRRYIERRLREDFEFTGTPIQISVRVRERKQRR